MIGVAFSIHRNGMNSIDLLCYVRVIRPRIVFVFVIKVVPVQLWCRVIINVVDTRDDRGRRESREIRAVSTAGVPERPCHASKNTASKGHYPYDDHPADRHQRNHSSLNTVLTTMRRLRRATAFEGPGWGAAPAGGDTGAARPFAEHALRMAIAHTLRP